MKNLQIILSLLQLIAAERAKGEKMKVNTIYWSPISFPSPLISPEKCGMRHPSRLCDPDGISGRDALEELSDLLTYASRGTNFGHQCKKNSTSIYIGFPAGVPNFSEMEINFFVKALFEMWKERDVTLKEGCGTMALILASKLNVKRIWVMIGKKLDYRGAKMIKSALSESAKSFAKEDYGTSFKTLIQAIMVINSGQMYDDGDPMKGNFDDESKVYSVQWSGSTWKIKMPVWVIPIFFACMLLLGMFC